jgi:hypothetical protein
MDFCQPFGLPVFVISIGVQSLSVGKLITDDFLSLFVSMPANFYYSVFKQGTDAVIEALIPPYDG